MSQEVVIYESPEMARVVDDVINTPESQRSRRIYTLDIQYFRKWLQERGGNYTILSESDALAYKDYLQGQFEKATAQRMLVVARLLFAKLKRRNLIQFDPFSEIKGFSLDNESSHIALTKEQAKALLSSIDTSTVKGMRDYAIISLLLRTGLRREECASLTIGDLSLEQGHHIATIQHGKGNKRRKVKVPVDVFRSIKLYIEASGRTITSLENPLFLSFDRRPQYAGGRISDKVIERITREYGEKIGFDQQTNPLTPHDLRTTFITLALEGNASLEQTQYAAGHKDPRTTERYQKRKFNLDDNAVDHIHL